MTLVDHIISFTQTVKPSDSMPPQLQLFSPERVSYFQELNKYGEYTVDFLLVISELIMIQEKTNYPDGTLHIRPFRLFRKKADIFSVVSAATFR